MKKHGQKWKRKNSTVAVEIVKTESPSTTVTTVLLSNTNATLQEHVYRNGNNGASGKQFDEQTPLKIMEQPGPTLSPNLTPPKLFNYFHERTDEETAIAEEQILEKQNAWQSSRNRQLPSWMSTCAIPEAKRAIPLHSQDLDQGN